MRILEYITVGCVRVSVITVFEVHGQLNWHIQAAEFSFHEILSFQYLAIRDKQLQLGISLPVSRQEYKNHLSSLLLESTDAALPLVVTFSNQITQVNAETQLIFELLFFRDIVDSVQDWSSFLALSFTPGRNQE